MNSEYLIKIKYWLNFCRKSKNVAVEEPKEIKTNPAKAPEPIGTT